MGTEIKRIGSPNKKWIKLLVTTTIGKISVGNSIFFIRFPWVIKTFADSKDEATNQTCQGRTPQNKKSAYSQGDEPNSSILGRIMNPKTRV
jgi:hypothetical protein